MKNLFFHSLTKVIGTLLTTLSGSLCLIDKSGLINFMEFVCCLWNLLTLPEPDLGSIAYLIRDPSGTSALRCE